MSIASRLRGTTRLLENRSFCRGFVLISLEKNEALSPTQEKPLKPGRGSDSGACSLSPWRGSRQRTVAPGWRKGGVAVALALAASPVYYRTAEVPEWAPVVLGVQSAPLMRNPAEAAPRVKSAFPVCPPVPNTWHRQLLVLGDPPSFGDSTVPFFYSLTLPFFCFLFYTEIS